MRFLAILMPEGVFKQLSAFLYKLIMNFCLDKQSIHSELSYLLTKKVYIYIYIYIYYFPCFLFQKVEFSICLYQELMEITPTNPRALEKF